ncbi:MAG: dihydrodipicolinate synthase family protein [Trueperaceae bacterium]|nr:dihydrodipicolinate synthase family protein [Trueperaceae bacterium]
MRRSRGSSRPWWRANSSSCPTLNAFGSSTWWPHASTVASPWWPAWQAPALRTPLRSRRRPRDVGADALIAMPPYVGGTNRAQIFDYYEAIARAARLPLMIQNAGPPVGTPLAVEDLIELVERVPEIVAIEQETSPNPQTVGRIVEAGDGRLEGVFGGLGGIYLFNELRRGATGTMPACQFADVAVQVFDLYHEGDEDRAREVYADLQPALVMERLYEMTFMKECLKRRGVIDTAVTRVPETPMDAADHAELDRIWNALGTHFTWHAGK